MTERRRIQVHGIVQGVGFRPFVYNLATRANLSGYVLNDAAGVTIEVEGESPVLNEFVAALRAEAPPLALVERITAEALPLLGNGLQFAIAESRSAETRRAFISPDVATCDDCLHELFDPTDRRYHYPFINCTHCGPRFTIIRDVPYDRPLTTMAAFAMCADCRREYDDPCDRRFHAQPNACPKCGPRLRLTSTYSGHALAEESDALEAAQIFLADGHILAIKGLGGYHLACDAANPEAVRRLRSRKHRWDKPFALMAADLAAVEALCDVSDSERALLTDRRRPIMLLRNKLSSPSKKGAGGEGVALDVAPQQNTLGVMLPYTPQHHLLFANADYRWLVMTSGNVSDEPIAYRDYDAFERLAPLADAFLVHDRDIHMRCDDSVMRVVRGIEVPLRRSRGYAPQPLPMSFEFTQPILAVGAHLKNTFCLGKGHYAFLSHHIGDLDNLETWQSFREGIEHFKRLFDIEPDVIAHDLHPDYLSTQWAISHHAKRSKIIIPVQHHHAHIASVLAEHGLTGPVIGAAFDGTGYGTDETIWGGEFLVADLADFERVAHLAYVPLPGGEQAIHQPWRVAAAWLQKLYGDEWLDWPLDFSRKVDRQTWAVLRQMMGRGVNCPLTSSMGRLFDAVAALLGLRNEVRYEGQAAVELEAIADETVREGYEFDLHGPVADPTPVFNDLLSDLRSGRPTPVISARFHNAVAALVTTVCLRMRAERGLNTVALSGGVFQNAFLLARTLDLLSALEFETYINQRVPPNDGGIALGQAAVAAARIAGETAH